MKRRVWRFAFFALAILVGVTAGLGYGWGVNPVRYASTRPELLRIDYQADFVLMAAELYRAESDLALALARLDYLGEQSTLVLLEATLSFAQKHRFAPADQALIQSLAEDIHRALDGLQ
ncbi:MAG: hypothetical protein GX142_08160 [Chloroflexi bacterium]|nr:hypothetical protein [Chloroflexota bacterium]